MTNKKAGIPVPDREQLLAAYKVIVDYLRGNTRDKNLLANFQGTEDRCVRALLETTKSDQEIALELDGIIKVAFPVTRRSKGNSGLIVQGPISVTSFCPHHLYPVRYNAFVSYIPQGGVLGLSKLARITQLLGQRPVLQEQLASDIADVLYCPTGSRRGGFPGIASQGSGVALVGEHMCMSCRGVREKALTSVVELRGAYWDTDMEQKLYQQMQIIKTTEL